MDDLDLDRALEKAFAVTPSPEFVARVRTKISAAPPPPALAGWLKPAAVLACAAVLAIAAVAGLKLGTTRMPSAVVVPTLRSASPVAAPSAVAQTFRSVNPVVMATPTSADRVVAPARSPAVVEPPLPEVIIAAEDVEAFRQFVTAARERRFSASFDKTPESTPWVITDLSISPVTIEPPESAPAHNN